MRRLGLTILALLITIASLPLFANPGAEEQGSTPIKSVEATQDLGQDNSPANTTDLMKDGNACASPETSAFSSEPTQSIPRIWNPEDGYQTAAGGGGLCMCSQNCCTGCPGICCLQGGPPSGACLVVASCYRLDCLD